MEEVRAAVALDAHARALSRRVRPGNNGSALALAFSHEAAGRRSPVRSTGLAPSVTGRRRNPATLELRSFHRSCHMRFLEETGG
jgi:hypothetical protein